MADTFGVTQQDVGDQIPALFASGFTSNTEPSVSLVQQWISTADAIATMAMTEAAGAIPLPTDPAALLAKQYIINYTLAYVARTLYAGQDPDRVKAAVEQFMGPASDLLEQITLLGTQAAGSGTTPPSRFRGTLAIVGDCTQRELLVQDTQLDGSAARERKY